MGAGNRFIQIRGLNFNAPLNNSVCSAQLSSGEISFQKAGRRQLSVIMDPTPRAELCVDASPMPSFDAYLLKPVELGHADRLVDCSPE
jgi:hypothetical protein